MGADELATLAVRLRRGGFVDAVATDCRLTVEGLGGAVLGGTTLAGRGRVVGGGGRRVPDGVGVGLGGGACEMICAMLLSRMKRPWPGEHVK
jgi:hypothetical protein